MRAARGQSFVNEQILRGPVLAALRGPVKGQCRLVCKDNMTPISTELKCFIKWKVKLVP